MIRQIKTEPFHWILARNHSSYKSELIGSEAAQVQ